VTADACHSQYSTPRTGQWPIPTQVMSSWCLPGICLNRCMGNEILEDVVHLAQDELPF